MYLRRVTSPRRSVSDKLAVVSVQDVKDQERVTNSYEDNLIQRFISAAFDYLAGTVALEGWLNGFMILEEEFELALPFIGSSLRLPACPFDPDTQFTSIEARKDDGTYTPVDPSTYAVVVDEIFGQVILLPDRSWPDTPAHPIAFRVRFKAGASQAQDVPDGIRLGIILLAAHFYQNREATAIENKITVTNREIEFGLRKLCGRYKTWNDHS